jgi:type VI secretion system secreted protein VgrG
MNVLAEVTTPLGGDKLRFFKMSGTEGLSRPFEYQLDLLSEDGNIDFYKLLGKNMTVKMQLPGEQHRYFDGYCARFGLTGRRGRFYTYHATLRPWLWFLTRTQDCKIFQDAKLVDIVKEVFDDHADIAKVDLSRLSGNYTPWPYCVQYRETDFNFICRLMEQEGVYYYFKHEQGKHTLVLADGASSHDAFPGYEQIPFVSQVDERREDRESIRSWMMSEEVQPTKFVITDFDYERPSARLEQQRSNTSRQHELHHDEVFDYPGEYVKEADGEHYVRARLESQQVLYKQVSGSTDARGMCCGATFKLQGHPRSAENAEYIVLATHINLVQADYEGSGAGGNGSGGGTGSRFDCSFEVVPNNEPYRPMRSTPKPLVQGPQTAIVVDAEDGSKDEIHTDELGRVRVRFHWDRYYKADKKWRAAWVRVSQPWAGKGFGFIAIPRTGQEVIVDFLEGDPDQPIITGRVYNKEQMPPWQLPAHKTRTGLITRSTKDGDPSTANELRFEDKKGDEQVYLHAEKNLDTEVENDETRDVGHDRKTKIGHDETVDVGNNRTETVGADESITISGSRTESVASDETITIGGSRTESVASDETITIGGSRTETVSSSESITIGASQSVTVGASKTETIAASYTQTVGAAVSITASGGFTLTTPATYSLTGTAGINLTSAAQIVLTAPKVDINTPLQYENKGFELANIGIKQENVGLANENVGVALGLKGVDLAVIGFGDDKKIFNKEEAATQIVNVSVEMNVLMVSMTKTSITIIA